MSVCTVDPHMSVCAVDPSNMMMIENRKRCRFSVFDSVDEVPAKRLKPKPSLRMKFGSAYLPKENDLKPEGEDAHFVLEHKNTIGVADGVGGWAKKGIDSGVYARELMSNCIMSILLEPIGIDVRPKRVLRKAYKKTNAQGSSTACILTLTKDNEFHAANIGDSGFMVFRKNRMLYKSSSMQHEFNYPYQLGNHPVSDRPRSAKEVVIDSVEVGDIVLVATDGLFDNIHTNEITEAMEECQESGFCPRVFAERIAEIALENSLDEDYVSPFMVAAEEQGVSSHVGGKYDDITVVVAMVQ